MSSSQRHLRICLGLGCLQDLFGFRAGGICLGLGLEGFVRLLQVPGGLAVSSSGPGESLKGFPGFCGFRGYLMSYYSNLLGVRKTTKTGLLSNQGGKV